MRRSTAFAIASILFAGYYFRHTVTSMTISTNEALANKNVQAFLAMIRKFESGNDYAILYGRGGHFTDFSEHPNIRVPFHNKRSTSTGLSASTIATLAVPPLPGDNDFSTAAGAYQINKPTHRNLMLIPGMPSDFSPQSQDILAVQLLKISGALDRIMSGDFDAATRIASNTWASLPYSQDLQNPKPLSVALSTYQTFGGKVA